MAKRRWLGIIAVLLLISSLLVACGNKPPRTSGPGGAVVTLRWCIMEGSTQAADARVGSLISLADSDQQMLNQANEIWSPASLVFIPVIAEQAGVKGVPVIKDPIVNSSYPPGRIDGLDSFESNEAALECQRVWQNLNPAKRGPIAVSVRQFYNTAALGMTLGVAQALWTKMASPLTGRRGDDLCGEPRQLTTNDVFELDGDATHPNAGATLIADPSWFSNPLHRARAFAHELGHMLTLGHGNGLDDNHDGQPAGQPGPRRYDEYCDPLGSAIGGNGVSYPREDLAATGTTCKSLMHPQAACTTLGDLQIEQARAAAAVMPGCLGALCKL